MPKNEKVKGSIEKLLPVFILLSFVMAFAIGVLWEKVSSIEKGGSKTNTTADTAGNQQQAQAQQQAQQQAAVTEKQINELFDKDVVKFGDAGSKLKFVIVEDPSCPYCQIANGKNSELNTQAGDRFKLESDGGTYVAPIPEMKKLVDQKKASLVYIYTNGHGAGEMGMKALYCANDQGKFWGAHDLLYTNDGYNLLNNTVKNDVAKAGEMSEFLKSAVDSGKLKECLESGKYDERLASDSSIAASLGVRGTPGFYVNTKNFAGAYSFKEMQSAVDEALK